jgi:hypothetical protein
MKSRGFGLAALQLRHHLLPLCRRSLRIRPHIKKPVEKVGRRLLDRLLQLGIAR